MIQRLTATIELRTKSSSRISVNVLSPRLMDDEQTPFLEAALHLKIQVAVTRLVLY